MLLVYNINPFRHERGVPLGGMVGALHKINAKTTEIFVGVMEISYCNSHIQNSGYVALQPLVEEVEGMKTSSAYNHKLVEQFIPTLLLSTYMGSGCKYFSLS